MAHVEHDDLAEAEQVYLARRLREAQQVEAFLTEAGVDYAVQVEAYARSFLFGSVRQGAAFYVDASIAPACRERLLAGGFGRGIVEVEVE